VGIGSAVERVSSEVVYEGKIATVRVDEFRHADGSTAEREVVGHPGAVAMVAHDDESLYLVRQPREAVGADALLELPAGKLDVPGESAIDCARRELAEEIGKTAETWRELKRFYSSAGFTDEEVTVFLATDLSESDVDPDAEERIEIVSWPLEELDAAIAECADAKSLVGLQMFKEMRRSGDA
jgi:8-oxo-dGTP pyrophosphatase MutT (NUDIX family)